MTTPRPTDPETTASSTPPLAARYLARRLARDAGPRARQSVRDPLRWLVVWWRGGPGPDAMPTAPERDSVDDDRRQAVWVRVNHAAGTVA